jgi:hypothetical protein
MAEFLLLIFKGSPIAVGEPPFDLHQLLIILNSPAVQTAVNNFAPQIAQLRYHELFEFFFEETLEYLSADVLVGRRMSGVF